MTPLVRRRPSPLSDMLEWLDAVSPLHTTWGESFIPVEEFVEGGKYVVRADLPGVDPDKDIVVSVDNDILTIRGERREEEHDKHRSEVRYGSFARHLQLPKGWKGGDVVATYAKGVLEVSLPVAQQATEPTRVPIARMGD
jgi:HSP20 family protein